MKKNLSVVWGKNKHVCDEFNNNWVFLIYVYVYTNNLLLKKKLDLFFKIKWVNLGKTLKSTNKRQNVYYIRVTLELTLPFFRY